MPPSRPASRPSAVQTVVGTAPELPETVSLQYGAETVQAPVRWDAVDPADLAAAGEFTVEGFAEGYAAGRVSATVTVLGQSPWRANLALTGEPAAETTAAGSTVDALNDAAIAYTGAAHPVWTAAEDGPETRWAGYTWTEPVRVDGVTAHFWSDAAGPDAGEGVAAPESWTVQVLVEGEWRDVTGADGYPVEREAPNAVTFDAVVTTGIRAVLTAQSDGQGTAGVGLSELEVLGETLDTAAPAVALDASGVEGANGWFLSPVTVRATATDDRDVRTRIEVAVDAGVWQATENVRFVETTVTGDGAHSVRARATDAAANTSAEASIDVRIDSTRPTVTGTLDIAARTVSATAADAGSGAAGIEWALDAPTGWQAYGSPIAVDEQRHVVYLRAQDAAGNVSSLATVAVPLSSTAPLEGNIAPIATATASYTSGWNAGHRRQRRLADRRVVGHLAQRRRAVGAAGMGSRRHGRPGGRAVLPRLVGRVQRRHDPAAHVEAAVRRPRDRPVGGCRHRRRLRPLLDGPEQRHVRSGHHDEAARRDAGLGHRERRRIERHPRVRGVGGRDGSPARRGVRGAQPVRRRKGDAGGDGDQRQ